MASTGPGKSPVSCVRSTASRNEPSWIRSQPGGSAGRTLRDLAQTVPGARREACGPDAGAVSSGDARGPEEKLVSSQPSFAIRSRAPRPTARRRREPLGPRSRGGPHPRRPHRRCRLRTTPRSRSGLLYDWATGRARSERGPSLQLLQAKRLPKLRLGRAHAWDQGCGVRRLRLGLEPGHLFGGRSLPAFELGARPGGGLQSLPLGLLANAVLERPPHPVVDRLGLGQELRERSHLPRDPSPPRRTGVRRRAPRSAPRRPW